MNNVIKELVFDNELVNSAKETKLDRNILYNHLSNGRITLQEYLSIEKKLK